jgi:hypothetical protein
MCAPQLPSRWVYVELISASRSEKVKETGMVTKASENKTNILVGLAGPLITLVKQQEKGIKENGTTTVH